MLSDPERVLLQALDVVLKQNRDLKAQFEQINKIPQVPSLSQRMVDAAIVVHQACHESISDYKKMALALRAALDEAKKHD